MRIVVTDLNQPMLNQAAARQSDPRLTGGRPMRWRCRSRIAFDVVACQFGVMFFPDKVQGYREARRVLKPGGRFLFNVWDKISDNEFADVVTKRWQIFSRRTRRDSWHARRTATTSR